MREKVANLMETTQRSEEEVCCALYECDNDLDRAVIFLLETLPIGAFETSSKKKKNRLTSGSNDAAGDGDWGETAITGGNGGGSGGGLNTNDVRERSRNRSGMRGGRGGSDSRGWRGRESRENERNTADSRGGQRVGGGGGAGGDRGGADRDGGDRWQGGGRGGGRGGFRGGYGFGGRGGGGRGGR